MWKITWEIGDEVKVGTFTKVVGLSSTIECYSKMGVRRPDLILSVGTPCMIEKVED